MRWFGEPWPSEDLRAAVCEDDSQRVPPPPPEEECGLCGKPIGEGAQGVMLPHVASDGVVEQHYIHIDCMIRSVGGATKQGT